jgi:hypothetical protein
MTLACAVLILAMTGGVDVPYPSMREGISPDVEVLQYDDGDPNGSFGCGWFGVWFDGEDFGSSSDFAVDALEFWFETIDTEGCFGADFYGILANGPISGPTTDSIMKQATSVHLSVVYVDFCGAQMDNDFWAIRYSDQIVPMVLTDNGAEPPYHSRCAPYYDDPWNPGLLVDEDLLIRAHGQFVEPVESTTWGSIKTLY